MKDSARSCKPRRVSSRLKKKVPKKYYDLSSDESDDFDTGTSSKRFSKAKPSINDDDDDDDVILCDSGDEKTEPSLDANEVRKRNAFIEKIKKTYQQLFDEISFNTELNVREIMVVANTRVARERAELKAEYEAKIKEIKSKQWCANCGEEAIYFCCWNTSYCSEECQRNHWKNKHSYICTRHLFNIKQSRLQEQSLTTSAANLSRA